MRMIITNGRVIDPATGLDGCLDVLVEDDKVAGIAPQIEADNAVVIDARDKVVAPGLIDMHVHLREPGRHRYKETIYTGTRAAAKGGFTTVVCEPNTEPPIDKAERVRLVRQLASNQGIVNVYTKACITKAMRGKTLINVRAAVEAGAVAITDDGFPVFDIDVMRKAAVEAKKLRIPICPHSEESRLTRPREALVFEYYSSEARLIRTYIKHVVEETGCPFHFPHVSLAESVDWISEAKAKGLPVTAEATPHHFTLTAEDYARIGPNARVNPPLRSAADVEAIRGALRERVIDVIASDHAPHAPEEKMGDDPPFGIVGLETTLGIVLTFLVGSGVLTLASAIEKMTINPARILNLKGRGQLAVGMPADITIIDPNRKWKVDSTRFESKARNCPFDGWELTGTASTTILGGKIVMSEGQVFDPPIEDGYDWKHVSLRQLPLWKAELRPVGPARDARALDE